MKLHNFLKKLQLFCLFFICLCGHIWGGEYASVGQTQSLTSNSEQEAPKKVLTEQHQIIIDELNLLLLQENFNSAFFDFLMGNVLRRNVPFKFTENQILDHYKDFGVNTLMFLVQHNEQLYGLTHEQKIKICSVVQNKLPKDFNNFANLYGHLIGESFSYTSMWRGIFGSELLSNLVKLDSYHTLVSFSPSAWIPFFNFKQQSEINEKDVEHLILKEFPCLFLTKTSLVYAAKIKKLYPYNLYLEEILELYLPRPGFIAESIFSKKGKKELGKILQIAASEEDNLIQFVFSLSNQKLKTTFLLGFIEELNILMKGKTISKEELELLIKIFINDVISYGSIKCSDIIFSVFSDRKGDDFLKNLSTLINENYSKDEISALINTFFKTMSSALSSISYHHYSFAKILGNQNIVNFLASLIPENFLQFNGKHEILRSACDSWLTSHKNNSSTEKSSKALPLLWILLQAEYFNSLYTHWEHERDTSVKMPAKIISWQGPYTKGINLPYGMKTNIISGQPLYINNHPVGYNIYLPDSDQPVERIFVEIYGGSTKYQRLERAVTPSLKSGLSKKLLENGTIIIELNLWDLLGNEDNQNNISSDFRGLLHSDIRGFFEQIKNNPIALHSDLDIIANKNLPLFLFGASFGGEMVVEHAAMHPRTWSGYLSFSGATAGFENIGFNPSATIANIVDPLLLIGNCFDSRVSIKHLIVCQERAYEVNNNKIQNYCDLNPYPLNFSTPSLTGHSLPSDTKQLQQYLHAVLNFMQGNYITDRKRYTQALVSIYTECPHATLEEMFKGELWRHNFTNESMSLNELSTIYLSLKFIKDNEHQLTQKFTEVFGPYLAEKNLSNGLDRELSNFVEFAKQVFDLPQLTEQKSLLLLETYKNSLLEEDWYKTSNFRKIRSFLLANPELVRQVFDDKNDPTLFSAGKIDREAWIKREISNYECWRGQNSL